MTKTELEAFLVIERFGSMNEAAKQLYISQPALSRRIQSLERELGYRLFIRKQGFKNLSLTKEGVAFVSIARQIVDLQKDAMEIPSQVEEGEFKIASIDSVSMYLLPNVIDQMREQYPSCKLTFRTESSVEAYRNMESGNLDMALVTYQQNSKELISQPVYKERYVFITRNDITDTVIKIENLNPKNEIMLPWGLEYDLWHERCFPGKKAGLSLNQMTFLDYFLKENYYAIVPECVAYGLKNIKVCELDQAPEDRITYALFHNKSEMEKITCFLGLFEKATNEFGAGERNSSFTSSYR